MSSDNQDENVATIKVRTTGRDATSAKTMVVWWMRSKGGGAGRPGHPINPVLHWVTRLVRWRMPRALVGDQVRRVEAVPQRRGQSDLAAVNNWRRSLSPELQSGVISYTEPRKGNRSTVCRRRSWIATHRTTLRREYEGAGEVRCRALPRRVTSPDPTWASPRIGSISFDFKFPQLLPCTSHDAPRSGASPHPSSVRTSTMSR